MAETEPKKDEKYEGAPPSIVAAGKAYTWGWIGSAVGAASGAVISFFSAREGGKYTKKVSDFFEKKLEMNISGRAALMGGWALSSAVVGHYLFMAFGASKGLRDAHKGPDQFERIKSERDQALSERNEARTERNKARAERNTAREERNESRADNARLKGELEVLNRTVQQTPRIEEPLKDSAEEAPEENPKNDEITRHDLKKKPIAPREENFTDTALAEKSAKNEEAELTR